MDRTDHPAPHTFRVIAAWVVVAWMAWGIFTKGDWRGWIVASLVLLCFSYLAFVGLRARRSGHFVAARYITTAGLAFSAFLIAYPIFCELTGVFGDFRLLVSGIVVAFPFALMRAAAEARRVVVADAADPEIRR